MADMGHALRGGGKRYKDRRIDQFARHGGVACPKSLNMSQPCNEVNCIGQGAAHFAAQQQAASSCTAIIRECQARVPPNGASSAIWVLYLTWTQWLSLSNPRLLRHLCSWRRVPLGLEAQIQ